MQAPVTASAGPACRGRPPAVRLEAVAVVEPLGRVAVAHRAAELDAPVRVEQLARRRSRRPAPARRRTAGTRATRRAPRRRSSARRRRARRRRARRPRLTLAAKPAFCSPRRPRCPRSRAARRGARGRWRRRRRRCAPCRAGPSCAMLATSVATCSASRIARDHDGDRPAVLPIPGHRAAHVAVARVGAQPQAVLQRREAQREGQSAKQQRAPAEVVGRSDRCAVRTPASGPREGRRRARSRSTPAARSGGLASWSRRRSRDRGRRWTAGAFVARSIGGAQAAPRSLRAARATAGGARRGQESAREPS